MFKRKFFGGLILAFFVLWPQISCLAKADIDQSLARDDPAVMQAFYSIEIKLWITAKEYKLSHYITANQWEVKRKGPYRKRGSGFMVSPHGYLLTCGHVASIADVLRDVAVKVGKGIVGREILKIECQFIFKGVYGRVFQALYHVYPKKEISSFITADVYELVPLKANRAKLIDTDIAHDIALWKLKSGYKFPYLALASQLDLNEGINLQSYGQDVTGEINYFSGAITKKNYSINLPQINIPELEAIEVEYLINKGNSGGPAVTNMRQVAGMNVALQYNAYLIPVSSLRKFLSKHLLQYQNNRLSMR